MATQPKKLPRPFAEKGSYDSIPDTSTVYGRATYQKGFPPETAKPLSEGGVPPRWMDFQGILHDITAHICHIQNGGHYTWDNKTDYPAGALVVGSDNKLYVALKAVGPTSSGSAVNPTTDNGTNWQSFNLNDYLPLSGGTMTGKLFLKAGDASAICSTDDNVYIKLSGGATPQVTGGAQLVLTGKEYNSASYGQGGWFIRAHDGTNEKKLIGKPDGTLTWDGTDISLKGHTHSYVPTTRTVNGKALSSNITLAASDVSAVPTTRKVNGKALSADISLTASDVGASASNHTHSYVPTTRTVNGKALSANISLTASDVGAAVSGHTHSYLPLTGGTTTGSVTVSRNSTSTEVADCMLALGNSTPDGTANAGRGVLRLYGEDAHFHNVRAPIKAYGARAYYLSDNSTSTQASYYGIVTSPAVSPGGDAAMGGTRKPVYINKSGVVGACGDTLDVSITGNAATATTAESATTATNLGTATKGSKTQPIYLAAGVPTLCTALKAAAYVDICKTVATATSSASASKVAVIVENYVSGNSWYRVWSDGWIEQGGLVSNTASAVEKTVTLAKAFTTTTYSLFLQYHGTTTSASGGEANNIVGTRTKTTFKIRLDNRDGLYYACGY